MSNEAIKEMKNNIKNNYQLFKNNISTDFKNKIIKQKQEHFKKILIHKNELFFISFNNIYKLL